MGPASGSSKSLPAKLRELRMARGMSQQDLAAAADVSVNTIWAAEKGKIRPQPRTLRRMAAALGLAIEDLLSSEPAPAVGNEEPLDRYLRTRTGGRLGTAEIARLKRLIERLVEGEMAEPRTYSPMPEGISSTAGGAPKAAERKGRYKKK